MKDELIQLGFTQHEADIYLALIDIGQTGAGEIIKRTGLHRNIVYDTLDKLIAKKLAFKVFGKNIARFQASDPERLINEQETRLDIAHEIVPKLAEKTKNTNEIVVYDGIQGFRNFSLGYIERMKVGEVFYVLGAIGDRWYELMGDSIKKYTKLKNKKKIHWKMVVFDDVSTIDKKNVKDNPLDEVRAVSQNFQPMANTCVWEDRIALQTFVEPYSVIEIKNKALADAYLNNFNALWEQGKPL